MQQRNSWVWPVVLASALAVAAWAYQEIESLRDTVTTLREQYAAQDKRIDVLADLIKEFIMRPRE